MLYLKELQLASDGAEIGFIQSLTRTCYNGVYPFKIFPAKQLKSIEFEPITIFAGSNGSGKSTLLNIIASALNLNRHSVYNDSPFFESYIRLCKFSHSDIPTNSHSEKRLILNLYIQFFVLFRL